MITDGSDADAPAVPSGGELAKATTGTELTDVLDEAGGRFSAVATNDHVPILPETSTPLAAAGDTPAPRTDAAAPPHEATHGPPDPIPPSHPSPLTPTEPRNPR